MTNKTIWILLTAVALASCGGGSDDNNQSTSNVGDDGPTGQLFGLDGVQYSSSAGATDAKTVKNSPASGNTTPGGEFHFGYSIEKVCATKKQDNGSYQEVCGTSAPVASPATLSICGKEIATVNIRGDSVFTIWDLFTDQQSIDNFTYVVLMANTNSGDPLSTGIKIGLPASGCQTNWSWATTDIQNDAASFKSAATPTTGSAPSWPSLQAVRDYETASYRCARAGLYANIRANRATVPNVSSEFVGSLLALVDFDGHISGAFDFSVSQPVPLYPGVMTFSSDYNIAPGGAAPFTFSASPADPIPNLKLSGQLSGDGMSVQYRNTDDSLVSVGDGRMFPYSYLYTLTKYRFLARDLQYPARSGYPAPTETLALTLDIGTDNSAEGNFFDFPSLLPWAVDVRPGGLLVRGRLNGNTLTLHYVDDDILGPPSKAGDFSLTFDSVAKTLTGRFPSYDGKSFVTFGTDRPPLQGCGPSLPQQKT